MINAANRTMAATTNVIILVQGVTGGGGRGGSYPGRSRRWGAKQGAQNSLVDAITKVRLMKLLNEPKVA